MFFNNEIPKKIVIKNKTNSIYKKENQKELKYWERVNVLKDKVS